MKLRVLYIFLFFYSASLYAGACSSVIKYVFLLGKPIISGSYAVLSGDGSCGENGRFSIADLLTPELFLRNDYETIVRDTFQKIEEEDSWHPEVLIIQNLKKHAPEQYSEMKEFLTNNTGALANLNPKEQALVRKNPAASLWVMYNGDKAKKLSWRYNEKLNK